MHRRDMMRTGWAWATLALAPMAAVWADPIDRGYKVQRATYGTPRHAVDVTQRVRELARRDERFRLRSDVFGVAAGNKRVKILRITATDVRGHTRLFVYRDGNWVDAAAFNGWDAGG